MNAREVVARHLCRRYHLLSEVEAEWPKWTASADAILAALREAGLAVVPVEATDAMLEAGAKWVAYEGQGYREMAASEAWDAMLAAAQEDQR